MPTKNPRLNIVLEPGLYAAVKHLAKRDGVSFSLKARDLIREALEYCENSYWARAAEEREATFHKKSALTHKEIWK